MVEKAILWSDFKMKVEIRSIQILKKKKIVIKINWIKIEKLKINLVVSFII